MRKKIKVLIKIIIISTFLLVSIIFFIFRYISQKMVKDSNYLFSTINSVNKNNQYLNQDYINFIVLGLDKRDDILEKTETTDTVIFVSLNLKNFKINTISIPRDLWVYDINAKINEIYPLSLKQEDKYGYIKNEFKKIIDQKIDHVVVLTTDNLIQFVNLIGGVDLNLTNGFIDTKYPNSEYIKNPKSGVPIYKTIEFKPGLIHLDSSNITEFVRSRKGGETVATGGTDLARIERQQLLIDAILTKLKSGKFFHSQNDFFVLYQFWDKNILKDINDVNLLQILKVIGKNYSKLELNKINITVGTNSKNGVIYHPTKFINKQWVFIPSDKEYKAFQQFISDSI